MLKVVYANVIAALIGCATDPTPAPIDDGRYTAPIDACGLTAINVTFDHGVVKTAATDPNGVAGGGCTVDSMTAFHCRQTWGEPGCTGGGMSGDLTTTVILHEGAPMTADVSAQISTAAPFTCEISVSCMQSVTVTFSPS